MIITSGEWGRGRRRESGRESEVKMRGNRREYEVEGGRERRKHVIAICK